MTGLVRTKIAQTTTQIYPKSDDCGVIDLASAENAVSVKHSTQCNLTVCPSNSAKETTIHSISRSVGYPPMAQKLHVSIGRADNEFCDDRNKWKFVD